MKINLQNICEKILYCKTGDEMIKEIFPKGVRPLTYKEYDNLKLYGTTFGKKQEKGFENFEEKKYDY